jgi:hypothetical protein
MTLQKVWIKIVMSTVAHELWEINSTRGKGWYITKKWYLQLDLGSKFTIVLLVCLIMTLYTSLYLDNCWGQLLSLLERLNTHDNFCDKNIKHIVYNVQYYSVVFIIVLFPGCYMITSTIVCIVLSMCIAPIKLIIHTTCYLSAWIKPRKWAVI